MRTCGLFWSFAAAKKDILKQSKTPFDCECMRSDSIKLRVLKRGLQG